MRRCLPHPALATLAAAALLAAASPEGARAAAGAACRAESGPGRVAVIELYTSEGCSSCPPADRWLGGLRGRADVVALGFHVDYWDRLGWTDRFASPQFSQRQTAQQRHSGARFNYTPQVLADGRDLPGWAGAAARTLSPGGVPTVALALVRDGDALTLRITPREGAPARIGGYLAVVDDGLQSQVGAGENRGALLHHDAVVRELLPIAARAATEPLAWQWRPRAAAEPGVHRHWVAVATDGDSGLPLQALDLDCRP